MQTNRLFLDIHAIQILPPSNINRDDTGSPKTAQFGGVTRARVSSQAWKKAMRDYFRDFGDEFKVGVRTVKVLDYVVQKMLEKDPSMVEAVVQKKAEDVLKAAGLKLKDGKLSALFFLGTQQAEALAEAAIAGEKDKEKLSNLLKENMEIDIALFGRMLADDPTKNEDASSQVSHAISTHEVQTEYDYFTAKDDLAPEDTAGAAMIKTNEFNSSTLYRYANVAVHEFFHQMKDDKEITARALRLYIEAFAKSMPTGKSNSYANQTIPQALLVILRDDRPISFVSAYENPVKAKNGYTEESVRRLFAEGKNAEKFVHAPLASFCLLTNDAWYPSETENTFAGIKETGITALLDDLSKQIITLL